MFPPWYRARFALPLLSVASLALAAPETQTLIIDPAGVALELVKLPGGCFNMGSPPGEAGRNPDEVLHQVCLEPFWIGRYEVTNRQFRQFRRDHDSGAYHGVPLNGDLQPVVRITWFQAGDFAAWLSQLSGHSLRLPTEAEWEFAARAGSAAARPWGEDPALGCGHANLHDVTSRRAFPELNWPAHECSDRFSATAPVGSFPPNGYGLHDMLGNVWEWVCSAYSGRAGSPGAELGCAPLPAGPERAGLRGGSWVSLPYQARSAYRGDFNPDQAFLAAGVRLALAVEP